MAACTSICNYMDLLCIYVLSDCGGAPSVTLNCADGSAHVDWVASQPGCQFHCQAHWSCTNMTHYHRNTVTVAS